MVLPARVAMPSAASIIPAIVEQHAEDAAFLWSIRDAAIDQPHYALRHLVDLDERIEAHLDGLRVAGEAGLEIAWAQLEQICGAGELFVVATLALETRNRTGIERILQVAESVSKCHRGLFGALGWVSRESLRGHVATWLDAPASFLRLVGAVACSLHRADPSSRLERLLDDVPPVRARALRLAGELGRVDLRERVRCALVDEDDACRFWAAWSAGLLGDRAPAIPILKSYAAASGSFKWRALDIVLRLMDREAAVGWLRDLGSEPSNVRLLVAAAGVLGDPVVVPWLVQKMNVPMLARVAGESFSMITGADLSQHGLNGAVPEESAAGPTDEPNEESVEIDPDENLRWPDPIKVQAWWQKESSRFAQGKRYVRGLQLCREACSEVLRDGFQRQRRAAAYELALMSLGEILKNWRARSERQRSA